MRRGNDAVESKRMEKGITVKEYRKICRGKLESKRIGKRNEIEGG